MKIVNRLIVALMLVATAAITGCDSESTAGISKVTFYPELELEGKATVVLAKGASFTEPGYVAYLKGAVATDKVTVSGTVNTAIEGAYTLKYTIFNEDGFAATASRRVIVYDASEPMCGYYSCSIERERAGAFLSRGNYPVRIWKSATEGHFNIDDMLGGWYAYGNNYGAAYAAQGEFSWDGTTMAHVTSSVAGWGDSADSMTLTSFDGSVLVFATEYAGMKFNVTATKITQ